MEKFISLVVLFVVNISGVSLAFTGQFGQLLPYFPILKYVLGASECTGIAETERLCLSSQSFAADVGKH